MKEGTRTESRQEETAQELAAYFPMWEQLTGEQRERLAAAAVLRQASRGTVLHGGSGECLGLLLVRSGQLRAYILSQGGREVSVYRLFEMDICLLSASCMIRSLQFELTIQAEKDAQFWVIPPEVYRELMEQSAPLANYTNQIMASRFSEVMWLLEQILWKSFDKRLASFLLEETAREGSSVLPMTHETIANHLGTAREVVTRMLRYFQGEGMVKLTRGSVEVTDTRGLRELARGEV